MVAARILAILVGIEKLASICAWTCICHTELAFPFVLDEQVFVGDFFSVAVFSSGSIAVDEVATLKNHKIPG